MELDRTTCLIERSAVRQILIAAANVNNEATSELLAEVDSLPIVTLADAEIAADRLRDLVERLKLEAKVHAGEARGANHTIAQAYQAVTQGAGEPGNWNGAKPIKAELERLRKTLTDINTLAAASGAVESAQKLDHILSQIDKLSRAALKAA